MSPKKIYADAPKYLVPPDDPKLIEAIKETRDLLEQHFNSADLESLYLIADVDKLRSCDFEVRRYLFQSNLNVNQAVQMITDRLKWRKEMSLDTLRYQKFPIEFYQSGGIFEFKHDNDGDPVLYVRSKFNVNVEVLSKPLRQFLIFFMNLMDQRFSRERSWGLVFDAQGFGWNNIDFDFLHLIIKILKYYMPWSVKYVIIYEIPWYLESIWKAAQHFIPEDGKRLIRVYNKKTIGETIDPINMPKVIGGLAKENHIVIPDGVEPATLIGKIELGLDDEEVNRIKKHLAKLDKEMGELIKA